MVPGKQADELMLSEQFALAAADFGTAALIAVVALALGAAATWAFHRVLAGRAAAVRQAENQSESDMLWVARRAVSPSAFKLKPHKINEYIVVPRSRIADLVEHAELLARELDLVIFCFGHAGDGNIHVNIMLDKANEQEAANGSLAKQKLFDKVIELSGTLSGEHGVGITKSGFLSLELSADTIEAMQSIKKALDPQNILNPGKIFPQNY